MVFLPPYSPFLNPISPLGDGECMSISLKIRGTCSIVKKKKPLAEKRTGIRLKGGHEGYFTKCVDNVRSVKKKKKKK